jgi:hypothetical protein
MEALDADLGRRLELWGSEGMPGVLAEAGVSPEFSNVPRAVLSQCDSLLAVVSQLDDLGVEYLRALIASERRPDVRMVILVHAACPTTSETLSAVLALPPDRVRSWVLPKGNWGQHSCWMLASRRDAPPILWISGPGNFGLRDATESEAHLVTAADPVVTDSFLSWFCQVVDDAAPLTAETAKIPPLFPAEGSTEAALLWEDYVRSCMQQTLLAQSDCIKAAIADDSGDPAPRSLDVVEKQIRKELKIPKSDPILQPLVQLFDQGDLVTIDKGSRIPPLEVPIKAEWFGIPSFREVGVVSREVRYKISVLDDKTNKQLDARRKGTSELREKFSFPLADGSRWMPHKAKPLFEAELKRLEEEGKKLLGSIISGSPEEWVQSKRDLVTRDANRQYEEFHPGKTMPGTTIDEVLKALTERFKKATSGNFLPKVSFVRTGFRLSGDSDHVSDWATARTLLRAIAEYPRAALKSRAYFFRGLKVSERDLLNAMNVAEDHLVAEWFQPDSLDTAQVELDALGQIDESERTDRDKCELILDLLHRTRPIQTILYFAQNKTEDLNVASRP